jgi:nucleoside-diphosphate-sugar epimerase
MPIVVTRACNIFGIGDYNPQRLIPGVVSAYMTGSKFSVRNQGKDLREYIHVSDVVSAYELILQYAADGGGLGSFNISSGQRFETIEIFRLIEDIIGGQISHEIIQVESLEIRRQFMDSSLLQSVTQWKPKLTLEATLPKIVRWYQENL